MNKTVLAKCPLYVCLSGSWAYGTNTPESDLDVRGIVLSPKEIRNSLYSKFEQYESFDWVEERKDIKESLIKRTGQYETDDSTLYDVAKVIKLLADNNPNILELLFIEKSEIIHLDKELQLLFDNRDKFISTKVRFTYGGYALSQAEKINRHRDYLLSEKPVLPKPEDFGLKDINSIKESDKILIEQEIKQIISMWKIEDLNIEKDVKESLLFNIRNFYCAKLEVSNSNLDTELYKLAIDKLYLPEDIRGRLVQEKKYKNALIRYKSYKDWESGRNPKRKEMEEKFGYDLKHASHLIRLLRTGRDILKTGTIKVKRDDFQDLLDIRNGKRSYEDVFEESSILMKEIENLYDINPCNLRKTTNKLEIESIYNKIINQ